MSVERGERQSRYARAERCSARVGTRPGTRDGRAIAINGARRKSRPVGGFSR